MNIAILVPTFHQYDAISIDALLQKEFFAKKKISARIYSESWGKMDNIYNIVNINKFIKSDLDIVIFHYSTYWEKGLNFISTCNASIILKYHNITPGHFFLGINEGYRLRCERGREELQKILNSPKKIKLMAASEFNSEELKLFGAKNIYIVPPFMQTQKLLDCKADFDYLSNLHQKGIKNILMVGRIAPNKGHELLLKSFIILNKRFGLNVRLILAGTMDKNMPAYNKKIQSMIDSSGVANNILVTDLVSTEILKSLYLVSALFVTFSEHEGFCIPLVEAQALAVPILALDRAAMKQTANKGAFFWKEKNPEVLATSMNRILTDPDLQNHLVAEGKKNYLSRFRHSILEKNFEEVLSKMEVLPL